MRDVPEQSAGLGPVPLYVALQASVDCFSFCTRVALSVLPFSVASDHSTFLPVPAAQK